MARAPAFQAGDAGSIPVTRSNIDFRNSDVMSELFLYVRGFYFWCVLWVEFGCVDARFGCDLCVLACGLSVAQFVSIGFRRFVLEPRM